MWLDFFSYGGIIWIWDNFVIFIKRQNQKGVMLQSTFWSNYAIIGIPLATLIVGNEVGVQESVVAAVSVTLFNILVVIVLSI